jgi:A/G-specific adenine glycosylase
MAKRKKSAKCSSDEDSESDFEPASAKNRAVSRRMAKRRLTAAAARKKSSTATDSDDGRAEASPGTYATPHSASRHAISSPDSMRVSLLEWYSGVHEARGMPWRKPFDPSLDADARAQRAYEVRRG